MPLGGNANNTALFCPVTILPSSLASCLLHSPGCSKHFHYFPSKCSPNLPPPNAPASAVCALRSLHPPSSRRLSSLKFSGLSSRYSCGEGQVCFLRPGQEITAQGSLFWLSKISPALPLSSAILVEFLLLTKCGLPFSHVPRRRSISQKDCHEGLIIPLLLRRLDSTATGYVYCSFPTSHSTLHPDTRSLSTNAGDYSIIL